MEHTEIAVIVFDIRIIGFIIDSLYPLDAKCS